MQKILNMLAEEQNAQLLGDHECDMTIVLATGEEVTGIIESTFEGVISIRRLVESTTTRTGVRTDVTYADIPRHYATDAVIGAYYTEGS